MRQEALDAFYAKWKHEPLVLLKWIAMQAASNLPGNTAAVRTLMQHEAVKLSNPNTCYSLFLAFARSPVNFHAGEGVMMRGRFGGVGSWGFHRAMRFMVWSPTP